MLLPKDYVRLRMTGEHAIDAADASGTLLFDVENRRWSGTVLDALELPREWLPPAYESTEIGAAGDQAAGALGVGVDRPGPLSVVLGTSGVVFAALPEYRHDPDARLHAFCHAVPQTWHAMGVMLSAAGSLQWLHGTIGEPPYEELFGEAAGWEPGAEGLFFQPYLQGSGPRMPTPTRAARSSASRCVTTAARSSGRCSRASRTAFATRSSFCASSGSRSRSGERRAAAREATCG